MSTPNHGTPGYNEGWYNGDPHRWIEAGTYKKYRDRLPGLKYSEEEIADLDAANDAAEKIRASKKEKPKDGTEAAALAKVAKKQEEAAKVVAKPSK